MQAFTMRLLIDIGYKFKNNMNPVSSNSPNSQVNSKSIMHQVELRKKKLQSQIHVLEKKLKKQQMLETKISTHNISQHNNKAASRRVLNRGASPEQQDLSSNKVNAQNNSSHSPRSQLSAKKQKDIKPAISETWKNQFKRQPIFIDPFQKPSQKSNNSHELFLSRPVIPNRNNNVAQFVMNQFFQSYLLL